MHKQGRTSSSRKKTSWPSTRYGTLRCGLTGSGLYLLRGRRWAYRVCHIPGYVYHVVWHPGWWRNSISSRNRILRFRISTYIQWQIHLVEMYPGMFRQCSVGKKRVWKRTVTLWFFFNSMYYSRENCVKPSSYEGFGVMPWNSTQVLALDDKKMGTSGRTVDSCWIVREWFKRSPASYYLFRYGTFVVYILYSTVLDTLPVQQIYPIGLLCSGEKQSMSSATYLQRWDLKKS